MMDTGRKRPLEGDEVISSKKRVTSSGQVQVQLNGKVVSEQEMPADENLEVVFLLLNHESLWAKQQSLQSFRKIAIYRRMKQYARDCHRAEEAVADLQKTRATNAASIAAMEACWMLVGFISKNSSLMLILSLLIIL
jgi:E3 ubiquitin-protein ligase BRE1